MQGRLHAEKMFDPDKLFDLIHMSPPLRASPESNQNKKRIKHLPNKITVYCISVYCI